MNFHLGDAGNEKRSDTGHDRNGSFYWIAAAAESVRMRDRVIHRVVRLKVHTAARCLPTALETSKLRKFSSAIPMSAALTVSCVSTVFSRALL